MLESRIFTPWLHKTCGVFVIKDYTTLIAVHFCAPDDGNQLIFAVNPKPPRLLQSSCLPAMPALDRQQLLGAIVLPGISAP
jgi:hypothetical protein